MKNHQEFSLFAPYNNAVNLIGSFSNWQEIPMTKGEDGYFRTQVELEDGVYQYKFCLQTKSPNFEPDEWIEAIDPYATDVDRDNHNSIVRIKDGKKIVDDYVWQHDDKSLPNNRELIIYELHIADFSGGEGDEQNHGKFQDVIEKLDYLSELGINAIEFMPVNEFPGDYSWGYKVRHFFATESSYCSSYEYKQLIDECHARGMRVLMDGIYNHSDEECPLLLIDRNYWYYPSAKNPNDSSNYWGPEFNYEKYDDNLDIRPAWKFIGDVVRYWVQEFHLDGIRFDAVAQLNNNDFFHWITQEARNVAGSKAFYNVGERIPESPDLVGLKGPMDGCWHESFRYFIIPYISGEQFDLNKLKEVLDGKPQGYEDATNMVNYLASHDRNHLMVELGDRGIFDDAAFKRVKLAAVLLMTAVGIPMIWMGEEFGMPSRQTPNRPNKLDWSLLKSDRNQDLLSYYKRLIALRKEHPAIQSNNIEFFHENSDAKVLAYVRWNDAGDRVVVVVNFSNQFLAGYQVTKFPATGKWYELTHDYEVEATDKGATIDLAESEAKVLVLIG